MKATIIGGGIIGLCSAYYLSEEGFEVEIIEREGLYGVASSGNLGMIVPSHFVPLASPGIVSKGLRWLLNSRSPFYIRPSFSKQLITWGWAFLQNATEANCQKSAQPLMRFHVLSRELYVEMERRFSPGFCLKQKGIIMYYNSDKGEEEERHAATLATEMGLDVAVLQKDEVQALEPNVQLNVSGGVHYRCDAHLNPNLLMKGLRNHLQQKGVVFKSTTGGGKLITGKGKVSKFVTEGHESRADVFVLAAGSWLPPLAKQLGAHIPVIAGKGYTFDMPNKPALNIPCILTEARVAITPLGDTIRYGGTMEIGTMNNIVNMKRVQGIVQSVNRYFTNVNLSLPQKENVWYGYRPCSPDGLPYLGLLKNYSNIIIAGGHSMMGLSLGAATGKLVSELASQQKPSVDISVFSPERFR